MSTSLFSPFSLRELTLANRIVVSPMCQYSAVDGRATDWHTIHWGQLLQSAAGMFTIEATAVSAIGASPLAASVHGYLLHEFLSPLSNKRKDAYGGSFDNRIRFPLEVLAAVREVWPQDKPLGVRISATDWVDGGWTIDDSIELAHRLQALRCDWIDVSSGGISPAQKIPLGPGYQVPLARAIRAATSIPIMTVGLITEAKQAEAIVKSHDADLIAMARAMPWDPRWPWHAAAALGAQIHAPKQYWRSAPRDAANVIAHAKVGQR